MRRISFKVKAVKSEEKIMETLLAGFFLILSIYLVLGMPVWIQLMQGQNVVSPGVLYEPIVEFFKS